MPQMMPLNWLFLLIFFISIFIMFNIMNYFQPVPAPLSTKLLVNTNSFLWKW
uniref:ATP synthase F0 subunit 8 n=1 Tax=Margattea multipunctata TaxID=1928782 RepID=UPI0027A85715|nr:ATP synthase F0 subunit 8 [Margattea multipunctata]WGO57304.1 ATP synthase F0 subunit 8 [Margattea multipunctata]